MIARWGSLAAAAALALGALACGRDDVATVARIGGERVLFADFEAFVRTHAGDDWMALEGDALRALFRQFLDEHLLARMARDSGLADADSDRVSALAALRRRLEVEPVGDEEVRLHLEAHPEELRRPERLVLGQLLLPNRALAEEALGAVRAGRGFAAVAEEMGRRPGVVYGGYTEEVSRQDLPPEFRDSLFALVPGEVSGVLEADYGYHLFHVRDRRPEEVLPLERAAESAVLLLERQHADRAIEGMLERARKRYPVEVHDWNLPFLWEVDP
ncbi:MAG TPA: peptidylprolyl isomerase [Thermoanaerobaculia bacterium]|nr:peptidylprolyl isomerase [Thermoanaerobaculia bacterium]